MPLDPKTSDESGRLASDGGDLMRLPRTTLDDNNPSSPFLTLHLPVAFASALAKWMSLMAGNEIFSGWAAKNRESSMKKVLGQFFPRLPFSKNNLVLFLSFFLSFFQAWPRWAWSCSCPLRPTDCPPSPRSRSRTEVIGKLSRSTPWIRKWQTGWQANRTTDWVDQANEKCGKGF